MIMIMIMIVLSLLSVNVKVEVRYEKRQGIVSNDIHSRPVVSSLSQAPSQASLQPRLRLRKVLKCALPFGH